MSNAIIQIQDINGNWVNVRVLSSPNDQYILQEMKQAKQNFGNKRVRAVDMQNRVIDILG